MGGTDDKENIIELSIAEHAEAHRILFEKHGKKEDELAWKGLSGMIGKEEIILELFKLAARKNIRPPMTDATKEKIRLALLGHPVSDSTRALMSSQRKNRKHTEESKQKISETHRTLGLKPPTRIGYTLSEAHKLKISSSNKGKRLSMETIEKIRISRIGKKASEETKRKMSQAKMGLKITWDLKNQTDEARKKRSASMKGQLKASAECPHCKKIGGLPAMKRWHFDNCKEAVKCA